MHAIQDPPVLAIPATLLDPATSVWCPWCRSACSIVPDESGESRRWYSAAGPGGPSFEIFHFDPPEGRPVQDERGRFRGWAYLVPHLCRSMLQAFAGPTSIGTRERENS